MKKNFKHGLTSCALLVGILAVIVLINVFVTVLVGKFPLKIDLTSTKLYEISDTTYNYLKTYDKPTTIYILASETDEDKTIKNILEKYSQANSNIKLKKYKPC
jgi:ABC-2 type transport system permease protein